MFDKKEIKDQEISESSNNPFALRPVKGSSKVVIGNGVIIKGEISNADDIQIDGQADLTIKTNNLIVGGTGELKGNIQSNNLDVWGKLEGEIKVDGTLTIQEQGTVSGSVEYQDLQVKLGGKIKGEIKSLDKIKKISDIKPKSLQTAEDDAKDNKNEKY